MKLNRCKFRVYLDIGIFIILAFICCADMLVSIIMNTPMIAHARVFIYVYLLNMVFYRLCIEIRDTKLVKIAISDLVLVGLCTLCLISTLMHVIYLVHFAMKELRYLEVADILKNHVTYATIVGCWFILYLANDNMTTFNNLYINK